MEARRAHNPKVVGSNPTAAISFPSRLLGGLAQVVEQPVHTRYVPGSNPGTATMPGASGRLSPRERTAAVARVRRAVASCADRRGVIVPGEHVLIACSGGPDSTALLDALARLGPPRGWRLSVAHVDHGLRDGSAAEAGLVSRLATDRGLAFRALSVRVAPGGSLQDRARPEARGFGRGQLGNCPNCFAHRDRRANSAAPAESSRAES